MTAKMINLISSIIMFGCLFFPWAHLGELKFYPNGFLFFVGIIIAIIAILYSIFLNLNKKFPLNGKATSSSYLILLCIYFFQIKSSSENIDFIWQNTHFTIFYYCAFVSLLIFYLSELYLIGNQSQKDNS